MNRKKYVLLERNIFEIMNFFFSFFSPAILPAFAVPQPNGECWKAEIMRMEKIEQPSK